MLTVYLDYLHQQPTTDQAGTTVSSTSVKYKLPCLIPRYHDQTFGKVLTYTRIGWRHQVPEELAPYKSRATEIGVESDCLMWGIRVIVPGTLRDRVKKSLHKNHTDEGHSQELSLVAWFGQRN